MIVLPPMPPEQTASWLGLLELSERRPSGWTLVGGQLVHLHCAERFETAVRPTNDADTVIDVRADPAMLASFTAALVDIGFVAAGISAEGLQHRWSRGDASIDVLLPEGVGERARRRTGVTGSPTLSTAGGTQALERSATVRVTVAGRQGSIRRPTLVGALVGKAAALENSGDPARGRHRRDFLVLVRLLTARDFRDEELTTKDRRRLRRMISAVRQDEGLMVEFATADAALDRLVTAAGLV